MRINNVLVVAAMALAAGGCGASGRAAGGSAVASPSASPTPPASNNSSPPTGTAAPSSTAIRNAGVPITDVSFVSVSRGWALGHGHLRATTDAGRTWSELPSPPAGVTRLRFGNTRVGYGWSQDGPLWVTTDGAISWHHGGLSHLLTLEISAGVSWALAGSNPSPDLLRAPVGSTQFSKVGTTPNRTGTLDLHGSTVYVMGQQGAGPIAPSVDVRQDSGSVVNRPLPCANTGFPVEFSPLGVSSDGSLFLDCVIVDRPSGTRQLAYTSTDQGRHWTPTSAPPENPTDVSAVPGRLFAWGRDLSMRVQGRWRTSLAGPSTGTGFTLVGFQNATHGLALGTDGVLHLTQDAGEHWTAAFT